MLFVLGRQLTHYTEYPVVREMFLLVISEKCKDNVPDVTPRTSYPSPEASTVTPEASDEFYYNPIYNERNQQPSLIAIRKPI